MAAAVSDLFALIADLPPGSWAAVSEAKHIVLASGMDIQAVFDQAIECGEEHPLMMRVPAENVAMFL